MIPNPWVLLASLVGAIGLAAGCFLYGEHEQKAKDDVRAESIALAQAQAILNLQAKANGLEVTAQSQVNEATHDLQAKLDATKAALSKSIDTERRLRDAATGQCSASLPQAAGVPVPDKPSVLPDLYAAMAEFGRSAATSADELQAKLGACEAWAGAVIRETGQTP